MGRTPKLDKQTKIKICKKFLSNQKSAAELGLEYNFHHTVLYKWVRIYEAKGGNAFDTSSNNSSYTKECKLYIVNSYLNGEGSLLDLEIQYDVNRSVVRRWVKMYNIGIELKDYDPKGAVYTMANRKTTIEERKEIIKYVLDNDNDIKGAADHYLIKYATVYSWMKKYKELGEDSFKDTRGRPANKVNPPKKLSEYEILEIEYEKVTAQNFRLERALKALKKKDEIEQRLIKASIERRKR